MNYRNAHSILLHFEDIGFAVGELECCNEQWIETIVHHTAACFVKVRQSCVNKTQTSIIAHLSGQLTINLKLARCFPLRQCLCYVNDYCNNFHTNFLSKERIFRQKNFDNKIKKVKEKGLKNTKSSIRQD